MTTFDAASRRYMTEIALLRKALKFAIEEADGWHDDHWGGPIEDPKMDEARALLDQGGWSNISISEEPVAWELTNANGKDRFVTTIKACKDGFVEAGWVVSPLYKVSY